MLASLPLHTMPHLPLALRGRERYVRSGFNCHVFVYTLEFSEVSVLEFNHSVTLMRAESVSIVY